MFPLLFPLCSFSDRQHIIQLIDCLSVSTGYEVAVDINRHIDGTVSHLLFHVGQQYVSPLTEDMTDRAWIKCAENGSLGEASRFGSCGRERENICSRNGYKHTDVRDDSHDGYGVGLGGCRFAGPLLSD